MGSWGRIERPTCFFEKSVIFYDAGLNGRECRLELGCEIVVNLGLAGLEWMDLKILKICRFLPCAQKRRTNRVCAMASKYCFLKNLCMNKNFSNTGKNCIL